MLLLRPIAPADLPALEALAAHAGYGLTSLPRDRDLLARRVRASCRGFDRLADEDRPRGETYLFVLEAAGAVVGTSGIVSKVGGFEPFYGYRVQTTVHASAQLNVRREVRALHLVEQHDGPCEVGSLFLSPAHRRAGAGRLLSLARFLFMADHPGYFDPVVIAELRGVVDAAGRSPFWDAVGHHFFDVPFPTADYLSMVDKRFIADLMPREPIYLPLLPAAAQAVVGHVQPDTAPALALLQGEGFRPFNMVDIFDAGPVVRCDLNRVRAVRQSVRATVDAVGDVPAGWPGMIVANGRRDFRATLAPVARTDSGGVRLQADVAAALGVDVGQPVRLVTPKPAPTPEVAHDAPTSL